MNPDKSMGQKSWEIECRGSREFLVSRVGALLCRIDREARIIYFWDKKVSHETPVNLTDLIRLFEAKPK